MSSFDFLQPIDKNLHDIICYAEKLYRDEYFEQCITQTRRFGENVCKQVLGDKRTTENTFDEMRFIKGVINICNIVNYMWFYQLLFAIIP